MKDSTPDMTSDAEQPELNLVSISQLVQQAKNGDRQAHSEICRQVLPGLIRIAERQLEHRIRSKVNPSDIVQATLTRMIHGFADFRSTSSTEFYAWLNAILRNEIRTIRRDLYRDRRDVRREFSADVLDAPMLAGSEQTPSSITERNENIDRFRRVITRLPADYATVIQLRGIEQLPYANVAELMNRSVDAVTKLFQRALIAMQKELSIIDESQP